MLQYNRQDSFTHSALDKIVPGGSLDVLIWSETLPVCRALEESGVAEIVSLHNGGVQRAEVQGSNRNVVVASFRFKNLSSLEHVTALRFYHRHDQVVFFCLDGGT